MKNLPTISILAMIFVFSGCTSSNDFNECSKNSIGENRSGLMVKCMNEKGYKLDGVAGTADVFSEGKWKKSGD